MPLRLCFVAVLGFRSSMGRQTPTLDALASASLAAIDGTTTISGLRADVRVIRDSWGVPHIYAESPDDLFFAQGCVMAQDRLWQMEVWRRAGEGRLSEILGPSALPRDRVARLLKYRLAIDDRELTAYHPDAKRLMTAYVGGINAFIAANQARLPVEFVLTGIRRHRGQLMRSCCVKQCSATRPPSCNSPAALRSWVPPRQIGGAIPIRGRSSRCPKHSTWPPSALQTTR
jgi:acyl-homoserine lactone acylase PvdQ